MYQLPSTFITDLKEIHPEREAEVRIDEKVIQDKTGKRLKVTKTTHLLINLRSITQNVPVFSHYKIADLRGGS